MERLVYQLQNGINYWSIAQFMPYPKSQMHILQMSFNELHSWICVDFQDDRVIIWDSFDEKHDTWENISKLYISKENYKEIVDQWNKNAKNPANYIVFIRDDLGKISMEAKESLSLEDLNAIEQDKQAKIKLDQQSGTMI